MATAEQPVETGMLSVVNLAPDGSPLGDGCFALTDAANVPVAEVCDNDASDFDSAPGVVAFGGIPAGQYTLTQTAAAEGFSPAAPVAVEHGVDDTVVEMVSQPATEETGVVELVAFDDDGNPIAGQCYTLVGVTESFGPFCDNGEGDTSADPGVLTVEGLPVGTYEAVLETAVEDADVEQAQQAKPRRSVSVRRGGRPTRTIFNIRAQQRQRGDLLIRVRDQDGSYLAGACFGLIPNGETAPSAEVCDNRGGRREQRRRPHPPHRHPGRPVHADSDDRSQRVLHRRGSVGPHRGGLRARGGSHQPARTGAHRDPRRRDD